MSVGRRIGAFESADESCFSRVIAAVCWLIWVIIKRCEDVWMKTWKEMFFRYFGYVVDIWYVTIVHQLFGLHLGFLMKWVTRTVVNEWGKQLTCGKQLPGKWMVNLAIESEINDARWFMKRSGYIVKNWGFGWYGGEQLGDLIRSDRGYDVGYWASI